MIDQWNEVLRCPKCHAAGTARLSQAHEAEIPTVNDIPDGFKTVHTEYGPDFRCAACNVQVLP
jgi:hypothetical protein